MFDVPLPDLQKMHRMAAALVLADPVFLPLFERIERELARQEMAGATLRRAQQVVEHYKAIA
ncbi:hypothetical protein ACFQXB_16470 [Plastorhodobacter daqingensis]|uniref:Uncharacterized protein n=1 Tax=Plastorhodobacter daqingensis TaxID=1387281 RepID=A0ABW2UM09_9RHOB